MRSGLLQRNSPTHPPRGGGALIALSIGWRTVRKEYLLTPSPSERAGVRPGVSPLSTPIMLGLLWLLMLL